MSWIRKLGVVFVLFICFWSCDCSEDVDSSYDDERDGGQDLLDTGDSGAEDAADGTDDPDAEHTSDVADAADASSDSGDAGVDTGDDQEDDTWFDEECPMYQIECDGECIPGANDPENCGGCGVTCGEGEVCYGGVCTGEEACSTMELETLEACDRQCVETKWNNDHCGGCGNSCEEGQTCNNGTCSDAVVEFDEPEKCEDGSGPLIEFDDGAPEGAECAGELAESTFRWGLCSCEKTQVDAPLTVDAFDSGSGPYVPGGYGGGAGANQQVATDDPLEVTGSLWSTGSDRMELDEQSKVGHELYSGASLRSNDVLVVVDDAWVVDDFTAGAPEEVDIGGTLYMYPGSEYDDGISFGDVDYEEFDEREACTECAVDDRIDVQGIVDAHSGSNNDNDEVGLEPDLLDRPDFGEPTRIELPCGHYYLEDIDTDDPVTIVATGNTALYVDGDINNGAEIVVTPTADAQLDVFVTGNIIVDDVFEFGSPNYPALLRVYIGGDQGMVVDDPIQVNGFFYSVPGTLDIDGGVEVFGGMYTQNAKITDPLDIHFDRRVTTIGDDCSEPGGDPDDDRTCQAQDEICNVDSDCCSPMECSEGTCGLEGECATIAESCEDIDSCCEGLVCEMDDESNGTCQVIQ